ncbi:MAG: hypothetical protein ACO1PB_11235 [Ramlibacter sp.]
MSASQASAFSAIAFQLVAALERYEEDVGRLVRAPADPELYQRVSRHVDELRMYVGAFPSLSVAWVEVLIRHFELTHGIWKQQQAPAPDGLAALERNLVVAVSRLHQLGLRLVATC